MEKVGLEYQKAIGVEDGSDALAKLRAVPAEDLLKAGPAFARTQPETLHDDLMVFSPIVDGWSVPDDPIAIFRDKRHNDVPVIAGANADEGTMFLMMGMPIKKVEEYAEYMEKNAGDKAERLMEIYPVESRKDLRTALNHLIRDVVFVEPVRRVIRSASETPTKAFYYHFAHVTPTPTGRLLGAHHAAEIAYVFGNPMMGPAPPSVGDEKRVADLMAGYWVNFAKTGDPNGEGLPRWPAYTKDADENLHITGKGAEVVSGFQKEPLDVFEAITDEYLTKEPPSGDE